MEWFSSLCNFRIQNLNDGLPPPHKLIIGLCRKKSKRTSTAMGDFARYLMRLDGKQHVPSPRDPPPLERHLLSSNQAILESDLPTWTASQWIFLFDLAQLADSNTTRVEQFERDLEPFLGLSTPLPVVGRTVQARRYD